MSQQSPRKSATRKKVGGAKAPSISARLSFIENFLREIPKPLGGAQASSTNGKVLEPTNPPIKPRLEALIDRAQHLNVLLDQLSHTIAGDGSPAGGGNGQSTSPFTIPDQLEMLETILSSAINRTNGLANRF